MKLSKREREYLEAQETYKRADEACRKAWSVLSDKQKDKLRGLLFSCNWDAAALLAAADKEQA